MLLNELTDYLGKLLCINEFSDYCPNGLQVGSSNEKIKRIGFAVTADLSTLETACSNGVNVLIVHHGLFWKGDPYPIVGMKKKRIEFLLQNQISLLAYHLPLDAHNFLGNNYGAALKLGWVDLKTFGSDQLPIGVGGRLKKTTSLDSYIEVLSNFYGNNVVAEARGGKLKIDSIALMSGGAYKELEIAADEGYDCFITGNFDEPAWSIAHERGINFLAFGHTATERVGIKLLQEHLCRELGLKGLFIETDNPF